MTVRFSVGTEMPATVPEIVPVKVASDETSSSPETSRNLWIVAAVVCAIATVILGIASYGTLSTVGIIPLAICFKKIKEKNDAMSSLEDPHGGILYHDASVNFLNNSSKSFIPANPTDAMLEDDDADLRNSPDVLQEILDNDSEPEVSFSDDDGQLPFLSDDSFLSEEE